MFDFCSFIDNLETAVGVHFELDGACIWPLGPMSYPQLIFHGWSKTGNPMRIEKGSLILYLLLSALKASSEKPFSIFHTISFSLNIKIFNIEMTEKEHLSKAKVSLVTFFFPHSRGQSHLGKWASRSTRFEIILKSVLQITYSHKLPKYL